MKAQNKLKEIRGRLTKSFPELAYVGGSYTIKMLDDDLKELESLMGMSSNRPRTPECDSGKCQFESDHILQL